MKENDPRLPEMYIQTVLFWVGGGLDSNKPAAASTRQKKPFEWSKI